METHTRWCSTRHEARPFILSCCGERSDLSLYKYVDDCTIYEVLFKSEPSVLQNELNKIIKWSESNNMKINVTKTKELSITFLKNGAPMDRLTVYNQPLHLVLSSKLLGVYESSDLKWSTHIDCICAKASKRLYALRTLKPWLIL